MSNARRLRRSRQRLNIPKRQMGFYYAKRGEFNKLSVDELKAIADTRKMSRTERAALASVLLTKTAGSETNSDIGEGRGTTTGDRVQETDQN